MTNSSEVKRRRIEDKVSIGTGAYQYIATTWVSETDFDRVQRERDEAVASRAMWEERAAYLETVKDSVNKSLDEARAEVARLMGAIEEYRDLIKLLATTKA